jgi:starvation-inducible outer membrane lipoprotein
MRFIKLGLLALIAAVLLTACATQPSPTAFEPPGFLLGCVHGFISPIALIAEIFTNIRVYAFPNSGGWYDCGFMLGASVIMGSLGSAT